MDNISKSLELVVNNSFESGVMRVPRLQTAKAIIDSILDTAKQGAMEELPIALALAGSSTIFSCCSQVFLQH
jgi:hypothetical protein